MDLPARNSARRSAVPGHHKVGVHQHVLRCTGTAPDGLRFELGLRPDGPPLAVYRSGEVKEMRV